MGFVDIRQSKEWSEYLEIYGWKSLTLSNGSILRITTFLFFKFAKLQRPLALAANDLGEINAICKKNKVVYLKLFPNHNQNLEILKEFKYKKNRSVDIPPKTMLINLQSDIASLEKALSKGCLYSINRSARVGDTVEIIKNPTQQQIIKAFKVISERGKKHGFYTQDILDLQRKSKVFGEAFFIANVYNNLGEILGTKIYLGYQKNIFYAHGGTTELGQKSKGGYKLLWDSIVYFKNAGFEFLDLEGLADARLKKETNKWQGYSKFKLKFNGQIIEYPLAHSKFYAP